MVAVTEVCGGDVEVGGAGAVEDDGAAAGRVGVVVVEVHEELRVGPIRAGRGLVADDLEAEDSEDAAVGGVVGGVVRHGLGRAVRRDWGVLLAVVGGAGEVGLWSVGVVRRHGRADAAGGGDGAVKAAQLIDGEVSEADLLAGVVIGEGGEVEGVDAHLVADVVEADLPADEVLDVLNDEMSGVQVADGGAGRGSGEAVVDRAHGHAVRGLIVGVARGHHIYADRGVLNGASS